MGLLRQGGSAIVVRDRAHRQFGRKLKGAQIWGLDLALARIALLLTKAEHSEFRVVRREVCVVEALAD